MHLGFLFVAVAGCLSTRVQLASVACALVACNQALSLALLTLLELRRVTARFGNFISAGITSTGDRAGTAGETNAVVERGDSR